MSKTSYIKLIMDSVYKTEKISKGVPFLNHNASCQNLIAAFHFNPIFKCNF